MSQIKSVHALEIIDSRGNPTLKVTVVLENGTKGSFSVPSGASTGVHEAKELRDGDARYGGKGVLKAVENVNHDISSILAGIDIRNQKLIDETLINYDGTKDKSKLGANAILGASIASSVAAAKSVDRELYKYIRTLFFENTGKDLGNDINMPVPMFNIINGGQHANNNLSFQEFMIIPKGIKEFRERIRAGVEIDWKLKDLLKAKGSLSGVGDEGGFSPNLPSNEVALDLIIDAIKNAGFREDFDIKIGIDAAVSQYYNERDKLYTIPNLKADSNFKGNHSDLADYYLELVRAYPIMSLEDMFHEDDWEGWSEYTEKVKEAGVKSMVVGDDLIVTNEDRLKKALAVNAIDSVIIKPNQIGTLSEVFDVVKLCIDSNYQYIISHRSGETEDSFIADLAIGLNAPFIKQGAPIRGERTAKYNRLLEIESTLGS
ncbi:MAG: phosphopyruvate hydratase [Candidatus Pacearchaeota archaeon]